MNGVARPGRRAALAALLAAAALGCEQPAAVQPVDWPPGTVLALNGEPISAAEVDEVAAIVARAEPHSAVPHLRRIALTNVVLARAAARQLAGEARERARAQAAAFADALRAGTADQTPLLAPDQTTQEGGVAQVGLELWSWALDANLGAWSDPLELAGSWRVARVDERTRRERPGEIHFRITCYTFPWFERSDAQREIDAFLDRSKLEFVDPAWRDVVPTLWQRRLRGSP